MSKSDITRITDVKSVKYICTETYFVSESHETARISFGVKYYLLVVWLGRNTTDKQVGQSIGCPFTWLYFAQSLKNSEVKILKRSDK